MINRADTIVAPATPPGVSALAVIRISGTKAVEIADRLVRSKTALQKSKGYTAHFGQFNDLKGNLVDEVVATVFRAPKSFTGEDSVEISFHGSEFIRKRAMEIITEAGARVAEPGEFTLRAFLNGKLDLSQAEAVADLIASDSSASHRLAIEQMRGGYSSQLKALRSQLVDFASLLELELDFSEEDVEFADRGKLAELLQNLITQLQHLSGSFASGNVIREGIPVAIIGKPNAGKSTLLNAILNEERAIVSEIAGTTRDTVEEELVLNGTRFRFIDTAGLRESGDTIESIGVSRSHEKARVAHIVLYLFDPADTDPRQLAIAIDGINRIKAGSTYTLIPVANKEDLYPHLLLHENYNDIPGIIFISAKKQENLDVLLSQLKNYAAALESASGEVTVTNVRHKLAIDNALDALQKVDSGISQKLSTDLLAVEIRSALDYLGQITGEVTSDDILGNIFERFCIGK